MTTIAIITAHPDDETFAAGCAIVEAVQRGNRVVCLVATPGNAGKSGRLSPMTPEQLTSKRMQELSNAAACLGIHHVQVLSYSDGALQQADPQKLHADIIQFMQQQEVDIALTFPEDGISGHLDHKAIHHAVTNAVMCGEYPHVQKLYYFSSEAMLRMQHEPSVHVDVEPHWDAKRAALLAHESQVFSVERVFGNLSKPQENRIQESFILAWERGREFPRKKETFFTDDLQTSFPSGK